MTWWDEVRGCDPGTNLNLLSARGPGGFWSLTELGKLLFALLLLHSTNV